MSAALTKKSERQAGKKDAEDGRQPRDSFFGGRPLAGRIQKEAAIGAGIFQKGGDYMIGCRPLTHAEVAAVERNFHGRFAARDRALFIFGCTTGFRISEILSLKVAQITGTDSVRERVRVARSKMKGGRRGRAAVLPARAKKALELWLAKKSTFGGLNDNPYVFASRISNEPISRIQAWRILRDAYAAAGLDLGGGEVATHSMRKTFADRVYAQLGDIFRLQVALGHASPSSTVSYLSYKESDIDDAVMASWKEV